MGGAAHNTLVQSQRAYSLYVNRTGSPHSIELMRYVDATGLASGTLMVRLHKKGASWPTGASFTVKLVNVSPAPDDPATLFTDNITRASVTFTDTESAPLLKADDLTGPVAGYLRCVLTTATEEDGPMDFTIGINVVSRNGG